MNATTMPSTDRISRFPLVGIDAEGNEHRFDWYRDVVYVLRGDAVERRESLPRGALPRWVEFVAARRGWSDCRYTEDGAEGLAEQIAEATGSAR